MKDFLEVSYKVITFAFDKQTNCYLRCYKILGLTPTFIIFTLAMK